MKDIIKKILTEETNKKDMIYSTIRSMGLYTFWKLLIYHTMILSQFMVMDF